MSEVNGAVAMSEPPAAAPVESPPAADRPAVVEPDARRHLEALGRKLARTYDRGLLMEYLRLRRSLR